MQKYWIDRNMKNCFMLYAKDLSITWGEDGTYWHWPIIKESRYAQAPKQTKFDGFQWLDRRIKK